MIRRFHGIDRHRRSSAVSVLNRKGVEEKFISSIRYLDGYIKTLGSEYAVVKDTAHVSFRPRGSALSQKKLREVGLEVNMAGIRKRIDDYLVEYDNQDFGDLK